MNCGCVLTIRLTGRRPAFGWTVEAAAGQRLRLAYLSANQTVLRGPCESIPPSVYSDYD